MRFYFCTFRFLAPWPAGRCRMFWNPQGQLVLGRDVRASDFLFLSGALGLPGARTPRGVRGGLPRSVGAGMKGWSWALAGGGPSFAIRRLAGTCTTPAPGQALPGPGIQCEQARSLGPWSCLQQPGMVSITWISNEKMS